MEKYKDHIIYDQWLPYDEDGYEKAECDIKLHDGTIIKHLWPNAGKFGELCTDRNNDYPEEDVAEIILKHAPNWRRVLNEMQRNSTSKTLTVSSVKGGSNKQFDELFDCIKTKDFKKKKGFYFNNRNPWRYFY